MSVTGYPVAALAEKIYLQICAAEFPRDDALSVEAMAHKALDLAEAFAHVVKEAGY